MLLMFHKNSYIYIYIHKRSNTFNRLNKELNYFKKVERTKIRIDILIGLTEPYKFRIAVSLGSP